MGTPDQLPEGAGGGLASPLEIALAIAAIGLPVFPCTKTKKPAIPKEDGGHGFLDAATDPERVRDLFSRPGVALVGVPTGRASGFDVIDFDYRHGAAEWEKENGCRLPRTRAHRTLSGGKHLLFRHAPGVRNLASKFAPGIDVRGEGGYVIFPPSAGYSVIDDAPIVPWPQWLLDLVHRAPVPSMRPVVASDPGRFTDKRLAGLLRSLLARVSSAPEGLKHHTLRNIALTLGGYGHLLGLTDEQLIGRLIDALPTTVADWDLARKTAAWGITEGKRKPLVLAERPEPPPPNCTRPYALGALRRAGQLVGSGERQLRDEVRSLTRFVHAGQLDADGVAAALAAAARSAGTGEREIAAALLRRGAA